MGKRLVSIVLSVIVAGTMFSACGTEKSESTETTETTTTEVTTTTDATTTADPMAGLSMEENSMPENT